MANIEIREVIDDRDETVATTIRISKQDKAELEHFAKREGYLWKDSPNVSRAVRRLIKDNRTAEANAQKLLILAKALRLLRETAATDEEAGLLALDAIEIAAGPAAMKEALEKLLTGGLTKDLELMGYSNTNANLPATPVGVPETRGMSTEQRYEIFYRLWYDALASFPPDERQRLAQENARHDADVRA